MFNEFSRSLLNIFACIQQSKKLHDESLWLSYVASVLTAVQRCDHLPLILKKMRKNKIYITTSEKRNIFSKLSTLLKS